MATYYIDCLRRFQKVDGRVYGGMNYDGNGGGTGGGGNNFEPSWCSQQQSVLLASDPISNYYYAGVAAKAAQIFRDAGFTTLGTIWQDSAELAWDWAEAMYQDYAANGVDGLLIVAHYITACNVMINASWDDATYAAKLAALQTAASSPRYFAAACIFRLTDDTTYGDIVANAFDLAQTGVTGLAVWEFVQATHSYTSPQNQKNYYNARWTTVANTQHANPLTGTTAYRNPNNANFFSPADCTYLIQAFINSTQNQSNVYLKLMQAGMAFWTGANQNGHCCSVGLGARSTLNPLHRDREAMGLDAEDVPGLWLYTWWHDNTQGIVVNNLSGENGSNFTIDRPTTADRTRVVTPYNHALPAHEQHWDNSYMIYNTEFTTQQDIVPMFILALWLSAWDGNTETQYESDKKRFNRF